MLGALGALGRCSSDHKRAAAIFPVHGIAQGGTSRRPKDSVYYIRFVPERQLLLRPLFKLSLTFGLHIPRSIL